MQNSDRITTHPDKKYHTIPFRLEFIQNLLNGNKLDPFVDINNTNTEAFINPSGFKGIDADGDDRSSNDTQYVLNKKLHDFYKVISQIGGKLLYIKSGTTGHVFKGIVAPNKTVTASYAVKVSAYPDSKRHGQINDVRRPENAELMMIRLLSYFVIKKQTPHIVLPIGTFNTSIKPFVSLIEKGIVEEDNKKYNEFVEKYKDGKLHDHVSILISEWANRGDLLDFIRKNYREFGLKEWKVIFFQLLSVLAVIQSKFPSFRHNDMKANNVLIHKVGIREKVTRFAYTVNHNKYVVPNIGFQIKLWDFDFACIPGIVDNLKVSAKWTNRINVKPEQNRYYDMHYFFNTLIKKGFFGQFLTEDCIPQEAKDFVNRIVPTEYEIVENGKKKIISLQKGEPLSKEECKQKGLEKGATKYIQNRGRLLLNIEYTTPDEVLQNDPFFEEFRGTKKKKVNKKRSFNRDLFSDYKSDFRTRKSNRKIVLTPD